jgi:superfamily II DNA or RNA helicase
MITDFKIIDKLSSSDFEIFIKDLLLESGWTDATITEVGREFRHGDGGVDIFAYKNKRKFAIEVKQRQLSTTVDVKALNQLVTGAKLANVTNMILVTNSYFTSEVKVRALKLGVELIDRDELHNLLIKKHSEIGRDIKPRKYQEAVIEECLKYFQAGKKNLLIEMATGLGKTYTVAHLVKNLLHLNNKNLRVLFLAHQVEILLQSVTAFKNVMGIGTYSISACFDGADPEDTDFVFGSFDTLYSKIDGLGKESFDIIIIDEAHHVPARTYSTVVNHFRPNYLIGLTATPYRMDDKDVLAFFGGVDGHIGKLDLVWALKHKKLAFPKYFVMLDDLNQARIDQLEMGLSINDLDKQLFLHKKEEEILRIIEKTIKEKEIENPKGIVFCRSIKHMKYLIQFFTPGTATLVHSKMTAPQRRQNIRDFREDGYRFILVCDLFNEGIDIPETNLLIFLRFTGSRTIWLQQLGRGLRKTQNKDCVYILDFVGSLERLSDIKKLQHQIEKQPIDKDSFIEEDEDKQRSANSITHDSSIEVSYNQSAAQVLKLIEDLQYRLNTRSQAIDKLRVFYEKNGRIPNFENLTKELEEPSPDQIATLFDSYFGYLEASVQGCYDENTFKEVYLKYVKDFFNRYRIVPSNKAISQSYQKENLLACTDKEVAYLLASESIVERSIDSKIHTEENIENQSESENEDLTSQTKEEALITFYSNIITESSDLLKLSKEERNSIKEIFGSEFFFIKQLKERNNK